MNKEEIKKEVEEIMEIHNSTISYDQGDLEWLQENIEKLCFKILKSQPQWVSVEDRLPEDDDRVLIVIDGDSVEEGNFNPCDDEEDQYWVDSSYCRVENVTHWMPLFQPPKND